MKIVYCTDSISYVGGISRVICCKASALADIEGNEVYIVVTDNKKGPAFALNPAVKVIDLKINYFEDDWKGKWYIIKSIIIKRRLHQQKMREVLNQIMPDVVIAVGTSEKNWLPTLSIASTPIFVRELHYHKHYRKASAKGWFAKFLAFVGDIIDYQWKIKKNDAIVVLTEQDKKENWHLPQVVAIPNPLTARIVTDSQQERSNIIITAGRLDSVKNFESLVRAWALIESRFPEWTVQIWGEGSARVTIQKQINDCRIDNRIKLMGQTTNAPSKMKEASIYVSTSIFEGWGLSIVEAMSMGLPVVAYDCPYGPGAVITNEHDGFLVPLNDEQMLAKKIESLITNEKMRKEMGKQATLKASQYSPSAIVNQWMVLFTQLLKNKRHA